MPGEPQGHKPFRQRLDAVLRQRDPEALRAFLVAEGQWQPDAQTDTEAAMWMMIAASAALKDMRGEAERWLLTHGHEAEASAILGERRSGASGQGKPRTERPKRDASGATRPPSRPGSARQQGRASRRSSQPPQGAKRPRSHNGSRPPC